MKVKSEQLPAQLKKESKPLIWISGDEPLLLQECLDRTREYYRQQGFRDREVFNVERGFDWQVFTQAVSTLSLFAEQKIVELRLAGAIDAKGKAALEIYLASPCTDFVLLMSGPQVPKNAQNTKWFKQLDQHTLFVQVWPLGVNELPQWLSGRLLKCGISASAEALQILVQRTEGNLLAASQEIEKLALLLEVEPGAGKPVPLDAHTIARVVADSARYTPYSMVDAALAANPARAVKIARGLRAEGVELLAIAGAMAAELRRLLPLVKEIEQGKGINATLQSAYINFKRKQVVSSALARLDSSDIYAALELIKTIDFAVKGLSARDPWLELDVLLLQLSGTRSANTLRVG